MQLYFNNKINLKKMGVTLVLLSVIGFLLVPLADAAQPISSFGLIPAASVQEVSQALRDNFNTDEVEQVSPLMGGFSVSNLFKLKVREKTLALRIQSTQDSVEHRQDEIDNMRAAAKYNVAPRVYYSNARSGVVLMDFIQNQRLTEAQRENPQTYIALANLLHDIHQIPKFKNKQNVFKWISFNASSLENQFPGFYSQISPVLDRAAEVISRKIESKSGHFDLNPNNILYDGKRFWVIDWETAGFGNPYQDLATVSNYFIFDERLEQLFLDSYFERSTRVEEYASYTVMKSVASVFYGLEFLTFAERTHVATFSQAKFDALPGLPQTLAQLGAGQFSLQTVDGLQKFGFILLKQAVQGLMSPEFQNSLTTLEQSPRSSL